MTETELFHIECDEKAGLVENGLRHAEAKQLATASQAEIAPAPVTVVGERRRSYVACRRVLAS